MGHDAEWNDVRTKLLSSLQQLLRKDACEMTNLRICAVCVQLQLSFLLSAEMPERIKAFFWQITFPAQW